MSKVTLIKDDTGKLSVESLREHLSYDPDKGVFTWRLPRICGRGRVLAAAGVRAGTQRPNGYRLINIDGVPLLEHRLAWLHYFGEWPAQYIDHINGDRSDNRISNLRDVSAVVNLQNMRKAMKNKKHGTLLGTAWHEDTKKWRALIKIEGRQKSLGYFESEQKAHEAYILAKRRHHEGCTI